jgi:hypothetical protein
MMAGVPRKRSDDGAFVRGTKAFQKFFVGMAALGALAVVVGFAFGALRAGFLLAERWLAH